MADDTQDRTEPFTMENGKIMYINFKPLLEKLYTDTKHSVEVTPIKDFMSTLKGNVRSSGKNSVSRLQSFLNAYLQETVFIRLNESTLTFINADHDFLRRHGHGEDDAEFYFRPKNGITYKLEAKMYWDESSFRKNLPTTNFHKADYVCVFFLKDANYRWAFLKKEDNYSKIYRITELAVTDPHILELSLPSSIPTIKFFVPSDVADDLIPNEVQYRFYEN